MKKKEKKKNKVNKKKVEKVEVICGACYMTTVFDGPNCRECGLPLDFTGYTEIK